MAKLANFKTYLLASCVAFGMAGVSAAKAQVATYYDNNVMVDLSVLEDNGMGGRAKAPVSQTYNSQAQMPPSHMPKSRLFGVPSGVEPQANVQAPQLRLPQGEPKSRLVINKPVLSAPKVAQSKPALPASRLIETEEAPKVIAKKPAPVAPKIIETVKAEPKIVAPQPPMPVEAPKVKAELPKIEAPKPVEAPKVVEAPKPKELVKEEVAKAVIPVIEEKAPAAPAPAEVMAEAPPPPPPSAIEPKEVTSAMSQEAEKAEQAEVKTETAALPPASADSVRVTFKPGQSKISSSEEGELKAIAEALIKSADDRVQLMAYAGGEDLSASKARRLSLSRALAVRSYLIAQGIRSTRIDVRALGNKTTQEPFDRVDVQIAPR